MKRKKQQRLVLLPPWLYITFFMVSWTLCLSNPASALMRDTNKVRAGIPPYEIVKEIISANTKALKAGITGKPSTFTPLLTWLTDSDARIIPEMIINPQTKIYTVRNLGNQLELATGAVDYGVRHMLTPVLLITANADNQAVRFFMEGYGHLTPAIRRELDHLHLALSRDNIKEEFEERFITNIESNVDYQVDMALARYHDRVENGRLVVIGSILDFTNRYKRGEGRLIIINMNGVRDSQKLRSQQILKSLSESFTQNSIGRERPKPPKKKTQEVQH